MELKFKKLSPDAIAPERKSEFAVGSDLCVNESKTIPSNDGMMMMFDIYAYVHRHVGPTAAASAHSAFGQRPLTQPLHHTKPWVVGCYYKYIICNT